MVDLMYKDLGLANNLAAIHNVPILLGSAVRQVYEWARASRKGKKDLSAVLPLLEEIVGVKARLEGS